MYRLLILIPPSLFLLCLWWWRTKKAPPRVKSSVLKLVSLYFDRADAKNKDVHYRSKLRFVFDVSSSVPVAIRPPRWSAEKVGTQDPFRSGLETRPSKGSWVRTYHDLLLLAPGEQVRMWVGLNPGVSDKTLLELYDQESLGTLIIPFRGLNNEDSSLSLQISKKSLGVEPKRAG